MIETRVKARYGKIVKIRFVLEEQEIKSASIEGDFYAYPEERMKELENALLGRADNEFVLAAKLSSARRKAGIELVGFSEYDIARAVTKALT